MVRGSCHYPTRYLQLNNGESSNGRTAAFGAVYSRFESQLPSLSLRKRGAKIFRCSESSLISPAHFVRWCHQVSIVRIRVSYTLHTNPSFPAIRLLALTHGPGPINKSNVLSKRSELKERSILIFPIFSSDLFTIWEKSYIIEADKSYTDFFLRFLLLLSHL